MLADDTGTRAIMTAHWLRQMGWDAVVLDDPLTETARAASEAGGPKLPDVTIIGAAEAGHWLNEGEAASVAIMPSGGYRRGHPEDATWAIRPRLDRVPESVLRSRRILVFADDPDLTFVLGTISYRRAAYEDAVRFLGQSARKRDRHAATAFYLGMANFRLKKPAESRAQLTRALALGLPAVEAAECRRVLEELERM